MAEPAAVPRLEVLSGGRAGLVFPLAGDLITVGRGTECHLRLDPDTDLQVSGRHALLRRTSSGWTVRDLGSRNGTLVNGAPVTDEKPLVDGDRITLGEGPVLAYRTSPGSPAATLTVRPPGHRRRTVLLFLALFVLAAGAAVAAVLLRPRPPAADPWVAERARMQQRLDSLQRENERIEASLRGQVSGLADALRSSREQVDQLRQDLTRANAAQNSGEAAVLRRRLQAATMALQRQQLAASLDFPAIERANRAAVAVIYVEYEDGRVATSTAFAVRPDGTLVTNRHALLGDSGRQKPRRIAVQFSDSEQVWPARLLATADGSDLAVVKVDNILGEVPTVQGVNLRADTLARGSAVALIGYPLGGDEETVMPDKRGHLVHPLLAAGILREASPSLLKVQGYGAAGASGSPIFDARGDVVGVLYGGRQEDGAQMLYAVPAAAMTRLLAGIHTLSSR